jgi:hypothetical protein
VLITVWAGRKIRAKPRDLRDKPTTLKRRRQTSRDCERRRRLQKGYYGSLQRVTMAVYKGLLWQSTKGYYGSLEFTGSVK